MRRLSFALSDDEKSHLSLYLHDQSESTKEIGKRSLVVVFPGGGYSFCSDREAEPIAYKYLAEGFHSGVLRYRVGEKRDFRIALKETEEAMRLILSNKEAWNIDKIYVIGFSAGGHLAAALSNLSEYKPDGCILAYPALLGSMAQLMMVDAPALDQCVTKDTPPTFVFSTFEDDLVPIENTIRYIHELEKHNVPFEAHIFERGGHGLSSADKLIEATIEPYQKHFAKWFDLSVAWIRLQATPRLEVPVDAISRLAEDENIKEAILNFFPGLKDPEIYKVVSRFPLKKLVDFQCAQLSKDEAMVFFENINGSVLQALLQE